MAPLNALLAAAAALMAAGCCADPVPPRDRSLEREVRDWLEGDRDPGQGNVGVSVQRVFYASEQAAEIELLWRYAGRRVSAGSSGWGRAGEAAEGFSAELKALERAGRTLGKETSLLTALPGAEAEIFLGEETAFTPFVYNGRLVGAAWERQRVGISLVLTARPAPDGRTVTVSLVPRFSRPAGDAAISLEEARLTVTARPGVPLVIGGMDSASDSLDRWLFGVSSRETSRRSLLVLTVRLGRGP